MGWSLDPVPSGVRPGELIAVDAPPRRRRRARPHRAGRASSPGRRDDGHHHGGGDGSRQRAGPGRAGPGDLARERGRAHPHHRRPRPVHDRLPRRRGTIPAHRPLHRYGARHARDRAPGGRGPPGRERAAPARGRDARGGRGARPAEPRAGGGDRGAGRHAARLDGRAARAPPDRRRGPEPGRHARAGSRGPRGDRLDRGGVFRGGPAPHREQRDARRPVVRLGERAPGCDPHDPDRD